MTQKSPRAYLLKQKDDETTCISVPKLAHIQISLMGLTNSLPPTKSVKKSFTFKDGIRIGAFLDTIIMQPSHPPSSSPPLTD